MRASLDRVYWIAQAIAMALLVAIAGLVLLQMGSRLVLVTVPGIDDYAGYCLAAATFMGLGPTLRAGAHIRVTMLSTLLGRRWSRVCDLLVLIVGLAFAVYFTAAALDFVFDSYELQEVATGMVATPLWIPRLSFPIGLAVLILAILDEIVGIARGQVSAFNLVEAQGEAGSSGAMPAA